MLEKESFDALWSIVPAFARTGGVEVAATKGVLRQTDVIPAE